MVILNVLSVTVRAQEYQRRGIERAEDLNSILNIEDEDKKQYLDQNFNASELFYDDLSL